MHSHGHRTARTHRAEFKGLDAQEFPPITEEQLAAEPAIKHQTWTALCKQAAKQGYTSLEKLDGTRIAILDAIHNPAYKPCRRWYAESVNHIGDGDYWQLEDFPMPAIGRHNPDPRAIFASYWKLGKEPVILCQEADPKNAAG